MCDETTTPPSSQTQTINELKREIERLQKLVAATERDLEKALVALDHHLKADR